MVHDYPRYDALGLADLVRKGEVSPRELLEAAIARADALMRAVGFTQACNASGHPAASVPLHIDDATNLLIGTQIIARMNDEATIFRLAAQLEQARPWFHRVPRVAVGPTPL